MNYLPGPITREKLEDLNRLVGADLAILHASMQAEEEGSASPVSFAEPGTQATLNTEPKLPSSVDLAYLPINVNPPARLMIRPCVRMSPMENSQVSTMKRF